MDSPHRQRLVGVCRINYPSVGELGKNALTAIARRPEWLILMRTKQLKWIFVSAFNQLIYCIQRHRRSHANLLESKTPSLPTIHATR